MTWEQIIRSFLKQKKTTAYEAYLKKLLKSIGENFPHDSDKKDFFDAKKPKDKTAVKFQIERFKTIISWANEENFKFPEQINIESIKIERADKYKELKNKFNSTNWITWASLSAKSVNFATHVAKLTHSAINSGSFYDNVNCSATSQLTTSSLQAKPIDGAVTGNQNAPIFQFLELELKGDKLASHFNTIDNQILASFADNNEQLQSWNQGFAMALKSAKVSTHALLKQVYFPINATNGSDQYHLLCNVVSSSLAHRLFETFRTDQQETLKFRKNGKYALQPLVFYTNKASLGITASNHGNASQLNGKRSGKLKLLSCQPPTWQSQAKPPIYKRDLFYNLSIYRQTNENSDKQDIDYLYEFLMRFEKLELSIKDPKRKAHLDHWVNNIIDEALNWVAEVQQMPSGWSADQNCKLKTEHQYLLDPYRQDSDFKIAKETSDWQSVICKDFANWLNGRLKGKDGKFTPQATYTRIWQTLFENELRIFCEDTEFAHQQKVALEKNNMSQYLLINRIQVQNANAVAGFTWGFPAITHFLGFVHNLQRKISQHETYQDFSLSGCAVIAHQHHVHSYKKTNEKGNKVGDFLFSQSKTPHYLEVKKKDGKITPPSVIEEAKMNLTVSLLISFEGNLGNRQDGFINWLNNTCLLQRLAGGTILKINDIASIDISDVQKLRYLRRKLLPGFILQDRSEYLSTHFENLQQSNPKSELLDAWLDFSALKQAARPKCDLIDQHFNKLTKQEQFQNIAELWQDHKSQPYSPSSIPPTIANYFSKLEQEKHSKLLIQWQQYCQPTEQTDADWEFIAKPKESGYLVPLMTGYKAITEVYKNSDVSGTRDNETDVCFVEATHSIGEWQSVHTLKTAADFANSLWHYSYEENWYLCKQGVNTNNDNQTVETNNDDELYS